MKSTLILFIATAVVCLTGVIATVAAQQGYYNQQIGSCPQCYSTSQFQTYESVPQPVYYDGYEAAASYPSTYQSPVIYGEQNLSPTYYPTNVVSSSYDSGQVVYSDPVYYGTQSSNPVVIDAGYSGVVSASYPSVEGTISSYPTQVAAPVYSSNEIYSSQSYPSQNMQTVQQYPSTSYSSAPAVQTASYTGNQYTSTNPQPGLAQQKADQAAQMGFRDHLGGGLGGAKFEGVGWSNQSAQSAIQNCCYWGQRTPAQIGISKSHDGCWYACVLYH